VLRLGRQAGLVAPTTKHDEIETRFRTLMDEADLPAPDSVSYEPESVTFYWHEQKLAVAVDFDED
jgi:hypothetical protein